MSRGARARRVLLAAATIAFGLISVVLARQPVAGPPTTYGSESTGAYVIHVTAGVGLLAAGWIACVSQPWRPLGPVTLLAGAAWFAPDWVGWADGPTVVRSLAALVAPLLLPCVAHLALTGPGARLVGLRRVAVVGAYGVTICLVLARALVRDPFFDLSCWNDCTADALVVRRQSDLARLFDGLLLRFTVVAGVAAALAGMLRVSSAPAAVRRMASMVGVPAAAAALALAASAVLLIVDSVERPEKAPFAVLHRARAGTLVALAVGVTAAAGKTARSRREVARLGAIHEPGRLAAVLGSTLGDPSLQVGYWLDGQAGVVDADGRPFELAVDRHRMATTIARNGHPIAVVIHDRTLGDSRDLAGEIGSTTRLAVDNERLRAKALRQLEELRESQARIVATADATRRALERDLHDGAQQRLLAASYAMRLASAAAQGAGDGELALFATEAVDEIQLALAELRSLAQGIHPAVLTEAGLGVALNTFTGGSGIAVELVGVVPDRYGPVVETTAYLVVVEAVTTAALHGATRAVVRVARENGDLAVDVVHDGAVTSAELVEVADRVGAAGGSLDVRERLVRARIPCAS